MRLRRAIAPTVAAKDEVADVHGLMASSDEEDVPTGGSPSSSSKALSWSCIPPGCHRRRLRGPRPGSGPCPGCGACRVGATPLGAAPPPPPATALPRGPFG
jgi:hypothetical protein